MNSQQLDSVDSACNNKVAVFATSFVTIAFILEFIGSPFNSVEIQNIDLPRYVSCYHHRNIDMRNNQQQKSILMDIPTTLLNAIAEKRCLLFIGAGFSLNADLPSGEKMPTWLELTKSLKKKLKGVKETDSLKIASKYSRTYGRNELVRDITDLLHVGIAKPGDVHMKLAKILYFDTIFTTNFEYLLEQAFQLEKRYHTVIVGDKSMGQYSPNQVNIIKMHGDLNHITDLVITENDYKNFMKRFPVIATNLSAMFSTKTPLFIGYSLSDQHLQQIRKTLRKHLGEYENKSYIVRFDAKKTEIKKFEKDNFYVINLETKGRTQRQCLLDFFCEIYDFTNIRATDLTLTKPSTETIVHDAPKKIETSNLIGRIIEAVGKFEFILRTRLEQSGVNGMELKKPLNHLIQVALRIGILSPEQITQMEEVRFIRNMSVHAQIVPSIDHALFVEKTTAAIIEKLESNIVVLHKGIAIRVYAQKDIYSRGETLRVRGNVSQIIEKTPVSLLITSPKGKLCTVSLIDVNPEGQFEFQTNIGGPLWDQDGKYTIIVTYGHVENTVRINFTVEKIQEKIPRLFHKFKIKDTSNKIYKIKYRIEGGSITDIIPDSLSKSLILEINSNSDGEMTIILPRQVIDAKLGSDGMGGEDDSFFVLVDGTEAAFEETTTSEDRTLTIPFEDGTTQIEIIGTYVFGESVEAIESRTVKIVKGSSSPKDDEKYLEPQTLIVKVGDSVQWINEDNAAHTITSGLVEDGPDGHFDSSLIAAGHEFTFKFDKKGTYRYFCVLHPWKEGKIIVTDEKTQ